MSVQSIKAALDADLLAYAAANPIQVAWEATPFSPTSGTPYLAPSISARVRTPRGPGADAVLEHSGTYQIMAFAPSGSGTAAIEAIADLLLGWFTRGKTLTTTDSKAVQILNAQARPAIQEPNWISIPVTIDWFSFE